MRKFYPASKVDAETDGNSAPRKRSFALRIMQHYFAEIFDAIDGWVLESKFSKVQLTVLGTLFFRFVYEYH